MPDLHDRAIELLDAYQLPEADATCRRALKGVVEPIERANLICTLAHIREAQSKFASARRLYQEVLTLLIRRRGVMALRVKSWRGMGRIFRVQGKYQPSAVLLRLAVKQAERSPDCRLELADAMGDLGVLYRYVGHLDKAADLYQRGLRIAVADRGPRHATIAIFYHMLAGVNQLRGRFKEAERQGRKSVKIRAATLGPDHPDTVADQACLATILIDLGQLDEAETILKHALAVFRKTYGEPHYEIAVNLHNLASIVNARGRASEAIGLFRQSLAMKELLLGDSHPDLIMTLNNLAILEADKSFGLRALMIAKRHLNLSHPTVALVRANFEQLL